MWIHALVRVLVMADPDILQLIEVPHEALRQRVDGVSFQIQLVLVGDSGIWKSKK